MKLCRIGIFCLSLTIFLGNSFAADRQVSSVQGNIAPKAIGTDFSITMYSNAGDYIGQGKDRKFTDETGGSLSVTVGVNKSIEFDIRNDPQIQTSFGWDFHNAEGDMIMKPGYYGDATRFPFSYSDKVNGFNASGNGRGCNKLTAEFYVHEIRFEGDKVSKFAADFRQACENKTSQLYGAVRFNSTIADQCSKDGCPKLKVKSNVQAAPVKKTATKTTQATTTKTTAPQPLSAKEEAIIATIINYIKQGNSHSNQVTLTGQLIDMMKVYEQKLTGNKLRLATALKEALMLHMQDLYNTDPEVKRLQAKQAELEAYMLPIQKIIDDGYWSYNKLFEYFDSNNIDPTLLRKKYNDAVWGIKSIITSLEVTPALNGDTTLKNIFLRMNKEVLTSLQTDVKILVDEYDKPGIEFTAQGTAALERFIAFGEQFEGKYEKEIESYVEYFMQQ